MRPSKEINAVIYPVDGNKKIEYNKPVHYPINGILAKTLKKEEDVKIIFIITIGKNSECESNKKIFINELEKINGEIGAILSYETVGMEFMATKQTYNKLLTDLAEKIPPNSEIYADITFGFKPEILSLFCTFRFVEKFNNTILQYIVYGKVEFNKETKKIEHPMLFDLTSLYYLFKLLGSMETKDPESALKILKDFFTM